MTACHLLSYASSHRCISPSPSESSLQEDVAMALDAAGMVAMLNTNPLGPFNSPKLLEILGFDATEAPIDREDFLSRMHPEDRERNIALFQSFFERQEAFIEDIEDEFRMILPDGRIRHINVKGMHRCDSHKTGLRSFVVLQDVTQQRESEELLRKKTEELTRVNEKLQWFTAVVAHDLKNPLASIVMSAELLEMSSPSQDSTSYSRIISNASRRALQLVDDLLELTRLDKQSEIKQEKVDTSEIFHIVLTDIQALLNQSKITIEVLGDLPTVTGNRSQLKQVMQNLLTNAIKFRTPDDPHVWVSATDLGSHWQFSFRDNGIGMNIEHQNRIFEPFQRLRSDYEGLGLGLSICKKIVEQHKGNITVQSIEGKGSDFQFTLKK